MGDIADMMLEGMLCQGCGEYLGEGDGFPEFCSSCRHDRQPIDAGKVQCPDCHKWVKSTGLRQHQEAKHGKA